MGGIAGLEKFKWCQLAHHQLMSQQRPGLSLVYTVKLKPNIKAQISGKLVTSGISDAATASINYEKNRMKKLMMMMKMIIIIIIIIIIMNKSQELTVFHGRQKMISAMKQRPEK